MMEKGLTVRRSRRAASLTAQVLWNMQIEDDSKPTQIVPPLRLARKPSTSNNGDVIFEPIEKPKRGRKRSVADRTTPTQKSSSIEFNPDVTNKKKKLSTSYNGHTLSVTKPLQIGRPNISGKLTASVAPLINNQQIKQKPAAADSVSATVTHPNSNPILLLPVSLQANQGSGQDRSGNVNGLSLVTLQAPPDLLNCFGLTQKQWNTVSPNFNRNTGKADRVNFSAQQMQGYANISRSQQVTESQPTQIEPLNLKMGETMVPSSNSTKVAHVQPRSTEMSNFQCYAKKEEPKVAESVSKGLQSSIQKHATSSKPKPERRKSRASPVVQQSKLTLTITTKGRKRSVKSPTPEYVCSSPDVDDVQRKPRHSCNRQQINLRHKAAPPPGSLEYEESIEVQRSLLASIKRSQKAKARAKAKVAAKKTKPLVKNGDKSTSLVDSDISKPFSLEDSNNGWNWAGKPYSSLVFSVTSGKHVQRCCYPGMSRTVKGRTSVVLVRDCVFLLAGGENELPYIAKVSALWEKPDTKEMMLSLVWFYRAEHTEDPKLPNVSGDELFLSRHQDEISVACVEERCNVYTYQQFCRMQAKRRLDGMWKKNDARNIVPRTKPDCFRRPDLPDEAPLDPEDMFFSRQFYDAMQKRIKAKLPLPTTLCSEHKHRSSVSSM